MELTQTRAQCEGLARELAEAAHARDALAGQLQQQLAFAEAEVGAMRAEAWGLQSSNISIHLKASQRLRRIRGCQKSPMT